MSHHGEYDTEKLPKKFNSGKLVSLLTSDLTVGVGAG